MRPFYPVAGTLNYDIPRRTIKAPKKRRDCLQKYIKISGGLLRYSTFLANQVNSAQSLTPQAIAL